MAGKAGTQMRDRSCSTKLKVLAIARASRNKTEQGRQKMKNAYVKLLDIASRVTGQAKSSRVRLLLASSKAICQSCTKLRNSWMR